MSPEAVTRRLKLMDELWVLSMKLMNAGKKLRDRKFPVRDKPRTETKDEKAS